MHLRESKHARYRFLGKKLADELNRHLGTDYEAALGKEEPKDVGLTSKMGFNAREVQIVKASVPPEAQLHHGNVLGLEEFLRSKLLEDGLVGAELTLHVSPLIFEGPMPRLLTERLAKLIHSNASDDSELLDEICELDLEVGEYVDTVGVYRVDTEDVRVSTIHATWAPKDGVWLRDAANSKSPPKYPLEVVKNLTLLIDGMSFVDLEQIADFIARDAPLLPFREIWVYTTFDGVQKAK